VGVEVLMVDHDGPAGQAGLQPRDIITGLNGNVVASGEALRRMIHDAGAGVSVMLDIFREGRVLTIRTKLASREDVERRAWARVTAPDPPPVAGGVESYTVEPAPAPSHAQSFIESMLHGPFTGLMLEGMQPQLRSFFGAPRTEGLLVQSVEAGSPAANAGLVCADVIVRADDVPLHTPSDWTKHLHASKGKPVSLTVVRQRHELMLTLQPESKKK
jgi:S1-C subfamily serine protease